MKAEKRRGRRMGGLLACFEAPADADGHFDEESHSGVASSTSGSSPASPAGLSPSSSSRSWFSASSPRVEEGKVGGEDGGKRRRPLSRRVLAKIVRSAVFVASLQKARSEKARREAEQLPPSLETSEAPPEGGPATVEEDDPNSDVGFSSLSLSSSSTVTSASSSFSSSTITPSSQPPIAPEQRHRRRPSSGKKTPSSPRGERSDDTAMTRFCLVMLVILFVVIFWGRLCAIIWTSTCLCFVMARGSDMAAGRERQREGAAHRRRLLEEWEKRRVVLAGLLDRSRRP